MTSLALVFGLALGVALLSGGSVAAFASAHALKKVAAVLMALVGAALVLALLGAPSAAVLAAVAIAFAYCIVGVAIAARLQEAYGSVELDELDAADEQDEPRESGT